LGDSPGCDHYSGCFGFGWTPQMKIHRQGEVREV